MSNPRKASNEKSRPCGARVRSVEGAEASPEPDWVEVLGMADRYFTTADGMFGPCMDQVHRCLHRFRLERHLITTRRLF
jgi:hypothetical protein